MSLDILDALIVDLDLPEYTVRPVDQAATVNETSSNNQPFFFRWILGGRIPPVP